MRVGFISRAAVLSAVGGALMATLPVHATTASPMNIAGLVSRASEIVVGTVSAVHQGRQAGLPYVEVELAVTDTIRGRATQTLTFRSVGLQDPLAAENGRLLRAQIPGMPRYAAGEQVVLFLGPTSRLGLRAPVGLQQGKLAVRAGAVQNDFQNVGLFANLDFTRRALSQREQAMVTTTKGALDASTFVAFVRRAVQENWWPGEGSPRKPAPVRGERTGTKLGEGSQPSPTTLAPKDGAR